MINAFLDWAQVQPNVWIVSTEQMLAWVRNPVPISQLDSVDALKCSTPVVSQPICDGIPANEKGLIELCDFADFPFYTCYGCPEVEPTPDDPNPPQDTSNGRQARFRLPANCSTPFWDPIGDVCICNSTTCQFQDNSRPIGPNGANLTGGGTGGSFTGTASPTSSYAPFNGNGAVSPLPAGIWLAIMLGFSGAMLGSAVLI
jgi:hypothetical protein